MIPGFYELRGQFPMNDPVREILSSFAETYLGYDWQDVRFPIKFWNILDRFKEGLPRTNNGAEGWHFRLNSLLPGAHPSMLFSINMLRDEENHYRLEADKIRNGIFPPRKLKSIQLDDRLKEIVSNYDSQFYRDTYDYLNEVQKCLHEFV